MIEPADISKKAYTVFLFISVVALAIICRMFYLQMVPDDRALQIAEQM